MRYFFKMTLLALALGLAVGGSSPAARANGPPDPGSVARAAPIASAQEIGEMADVAPCLSRQHQGDPDPLVPSRLQPYRLDSGLHSDGDVRPVPVFRHTVRVGDAPWLRIHFDDYELGERSYITLTSLLDGSRQRLTSRTMQEWGGRSAFFNGGAVTIALAVAPGEEGIFFRVGEIVVGEHLGDAVTVQAPDAIDTLCEGTDERVLSDDPRVGRLIHNNSPVCTAWIGSNGALMTAGHCVDFDPDGLGPDLPDGVLDLLPGDVVEFNVPASLPDGTPQFADADDQYPVVLDSFVWNFDGSGQGLGKDWAVFAVSPNANTGRLPQHAQGPGAFFRLTRETPQIDTDLIRITGFGVDDDPVGTTGGRNEDNQVQQTHAGPYRGQSSSGADVWHDHRADTRGANSGSPMIWEANGFAIGIHTNGGCGGTEGNPTGANAGTSFAHAPLEAALQNFPGPNTVYVDLMSVAPTRDGTIFQPFATVLEARDAVPAGGIVSIVAGTYNETMRIDKAMTLVAPVGVVTIGKGE